MTEDMQELREFLAAGELSWEGRGQLDLLLRRTIREAFEAGVVWKAFAEGYPYPGYRLQPPPTVDQYVDEQVPRTENLEYAEADGGPS